MKPETISIKTLPIEIQVVRVGNKQMTKAVFNQIPLLECHEELLNIEFRETVEIYGYVNIDLSVEYARWVIRHYGEYFEGKTFAEKYDRYYWRWILCNVCKEGIAKIYLPIDFFENIPQLYIAI